MQRDTDRDLIGAWRQGSQQAAQGFVRSRQAEVLSVAYLLTADRDRARGLACAAFLRLFRESRSLDLDDNMRVALLVQLGRAFLRGEYEPQPSSQPEIIAEPGRQKFAIESQRDRTLAALGRLDERERVALVLGEVGGFEPGDLNQVLERGDTALVAPVETGRQRIRQSLDIPQGDSVRPALLEAGFDGPRDDLWPYLEGPLEEVYNRDLRRNQILTYVVGGVAVLVVIVLLVALFGDDLLGGGGDDDDDAAVEAPAPPLADDEIDPGQAAPPPTPTPSPTPLPSGNVPDTVLAAVRHNEDPANSYTDLAVYNAERNALEPLPGEGARLEGTLSASNQISADGEQMVMLRGESQEDSALFRATAFNTGNFEQQWQAEVGDFGRDGNGTIAVLMAMAITTDRVYIAILNAETPYTATIVSLDRGTGEQRETTTVSIEPIRYAPSFRGNIFLYAPPDESRLVFALEVFDRLGGGSSEVFLHSIDLPELEPLEPINTSDIASGQTFPLWGARLTPSGEAFYSLSSIGDRWPPVLTFLDIDSGETTAIELPFRNDHNITYPVLSPIVSNDGMRLYVIDRMSGDVAIVHLGEQRLERFFPIDAGDFGSQFGVGEEQYVFGWGNLLSLDGSHLYMAAAIGNQTMMQDPSEDTGVWVIALEEWKIVDFWPVRGAAVEILTELEEQSVLVRYRHAGDPDPPLYRTARVGTGLDEPAATPEVDEPVDYSLLSLTELYRLQHGRAPTVNGEQPNDIDTYSTLPRIEVSAPSNVVSGVSTTIEVRILDPASGDPLRTRQENVRFDPDSTVTAFLRSAGQQDQLIVLAQVAEGVYQTGATLPATGTWTVDVAATAPDGTTSLSSNAGAFQVAPAMVGTDGNLYRFSLNTFPEQPVAGDQVMLRVGLMNVESGLPIPEEVELAVNQPELDLPLSEDMPSRIDVVLTGPGSVSAFRTALLYHVLPNVYEGTLTFQEPGTWQATIRFQPPGASRIEIPAGNLEIGEST